MAGRLLLYAMLWGSFGFGHSLLAGMAVRARMIGWFGARERLAYNVIAGLHLLLVLAAGALLLGGLPALPRPWPLRVAMAAAIVAGLAILLVAGRSYDLGRFSGLAQLRSGRADDPAATPEPLVTGGLNRRVRHPLYLGLLLLLWGAAGTPLTLATAACASVYIAIGIRSEERKLHRLYGAAYAAYCARVPALLPRPWRYG